MRSCPVSNIPGSFNVEIWNIFSFFKVPWPASSIIKLIYRIRALNLTSIGSVFSINDLSKIGKNQRSTIGKFDEIKRSFAMSCIYPISDVPITERSSARNLGMLFIPYALQ